MCIQPTSVNYSMPDWLPDYIADVQDIYDFDDRMRFVIEASRRNMHKGTGGPFAAAVFEKQTGRLISLGVNLVATQGLSMLHAEMIAISLAQRILCNYDLGAKGLAAHEVVASTEPCVMCFGAILWSGVRRVVAGASDADARAIGFDEGPKPDDWGRVLQQRGVEAIADELREEAVSVLDEYASHNGIIYNAREGSTKKVAEKNGAKASRRN